MKKVYLLVLILFICNSLFSKDNIYYKFYTDEFYTEQIFVTPDNIYVVSFDSDEYKIIPRDKFTTNSNGYIYFQNEIWLLDNVQEGLNISNQRNNYRRLLDFYNQTQRNVEERYLHFYYSNRSLKGKTRFKASSELLEQTKKAAILYEADNLGKFAFDKTEQVGSLYINFSHKPWAEGKAGDGIDEYIDISCDTDFSSVVILNGYVDFDNLNLYKYNSRVKKFQVEDLDNDISFFVTYR